MEKAHHHAVGAGGTHAPRELTQLFQVELDEDAAARIGTLGHLEAQVARHERAIDAFETVEERPLACVHLQHASEPARRDES